MIPSFLGILNFRAKNPKKLGISEILNIAKISTIPQIFRISGFTENPKMSGILEIGYKDSKISEVSNNLSIPEILQNLEFQSFQKFQKF